MESGQSTQGRSPLAIGCGVSLVLIVAVPLGGFLWLRERARAAHEVALIAQEERAEQVFEQPMEALEAAAQAATEVYDLDRTVRVIHGLDLALEEQEDLEGYLRALGRQDYRGVAPEVLEGRRRILEVIRPLYAKQTELADQQAMWEMTSELLLATLSVVSVSGDVNLLSPAGQFEVDRDQARALWDDLKQRQADRRTLVDDIAELDQQLFDALVDYADTYWGYIERWDRLSVLRDRAYLAAREGDWGAVEASASLAIAQAPTEREAHLLKAMALIEQGQPERYEEARALLEASIEAHPDQTAPAFLLLGVLAARAGDGQQARLHLQQAAAYYPKQSDQLLDMLDPYKMRAFLQESREGQYIVELYQSTMLGAGYFSPDLQLARLHFQEGRFDEGQAKVLDHFARRRSQEQWAFVIRDLSFCQELLGSDFQRIFPEDSWLDLQVSKPMLGAGISLAIDNRGDRTLHNATLILALHLTDQLPSQYTAVPAPATVPAVKAHALTEFGVLQPELEVMGRAKTLGDIVEHRAILISDEAVVWVDTDKFKIAESEAFHQDRKAIDAGLRPRGPRLHSEGLKTTYKAMIAGLSRGVDLEIEQRYGKDNVLVELPRELSILRPVFRLRYGEEILLAEDNVIEGDRIVLRFAGVDNFDSNPQPTDDLQLALASPLGDLVLTWRASGELAWDFVGVTPGE